MHFSYYSIGALQQAYHKAWSNTDTGVFKVIDLPIFHRKKNLSCISKIYPTVYHTYSIDR